MHEGGGQRGVRGGGQRGARGGGGQKGAKEGQERGTGGTSLNFPKIKWNNFISSH